MALNTLARKGPGGHPILTLRKVEQPPVIRSPLPSAKPETQYPLPLDKQDFEAWLWAERNAWDIQRRSLPKDAQDWLAGGGFSGRGKLSKHDADTMLSAAFAAIDRERQLNALTDVGKGVSGEAC